MGCVAIRMVFASDMKIDLDNIFLTKIIGQGGFGTVYAGLHLEYHSWFAVKRVNKIDVLKHKGGVDMLLRELEAWKRVDRHNYIAELHFAIQDKHSCYFLMDLMVGGDLRYYIKKRVMLSEPELAFLVAAMSSALHHIHSKNILHRDVKPENIIFDDAGYPYLTDFGVACICSDAERTCTLSSGTRQYLAPEMFMSSHLHGPAADFWALGVVLYELMFGKRPFRKRVPHENVRYLEDRMKRNNMLKRAAASPSASPTQSPMSSSDNSLLVSLHRHVGPPSLSPQVKDTCMCISGAASPTQLHNPPGNMLKQLDRRSSACIFNKSPGTSMTSDPLPPLREKEMVELTYTNKSTLLSEKLMGKISSIRSAGRYMKRNELTVLSLPPGKMTAGHMRSAGLVFPMPEPLVVSKPFVEPKEGLCMNKSEGGNISIVCADVIQRQLGYSEGMSDNDPVPLNNQEEDQLSMRKREFSIDIDPSEEILETEMSFDMPSGKVGSVLQAYPPLPESLKVQIPFYAYSDQTISSALRSLLEGLLETRPEYRLGGWDNYGKLVEHPWFQKTNLNWQRVEEKKSKPPFVPDRSEIQEELKDKYGSSYVEEDSIDMFLRRNPFTMEIQEQFDNFHHIAVEYIALFPNLMVQSEGKGSGVKTISSAPLKTTPAGDRSRFSSSSRIVP